MSLSYRINFYGALIMKKNLHPVNKLLKHIDKHGIKGLLPQNLPDELLDRMNAEADAIENNKTEEIPSSSLLISILRLTNEPITKDKIEVTIETDKFREYLSMYIMSLRIEDMRRKKDINVPTDSLPNIKNIFNKTRKYKFTWLK